MATNSEAQWGESSLDINFLFMSEQAMPKNKSNGSGNYEILTTSNQNAMKNPLVHPAHRVNDMERDSDHSYSRGHHVHDQIPAKAESLSNTRINPPSQQEFGEESVDSSPTQQEFMEDRVNSSPSLSASSVSSLSSPFALERLVAPGPSEPFHWRHEYRRLGSEISTMRETVEEGSVVEHTYRDSGGNGDEISLHSSLSGRSTPIFSCQLMYRHGGTSWHCTEKNCSTIIPNPCSQDGIDCVHDHLYEHYCDNQEVRDDDIRYQTAMMKNHIPHSEREEKEELKKIEFTLIQLKRQCKSHRFLEAGCVSGEGSQRRSELAENTGEMEPNNRMEKGNGKGKARGKYKPHSPTSRLNTWQIDEMQEIT
ncbi:hypothetical protein HOY80DRAFT_1036928 [Tuber brumale]|nr:hypothetical protein HOY80DRAFT_1036928 [Tuber brumale]